jgi:hypothetical protein
MTTRAEQSRINGRRGGRKPRTQETREFSDLDRFPWRTYEGVRDLNPDNQPDEFLSVEYIGRGRWQSVWHCQRQLAANPSERPIWEPAIQQVKEFLDWYSAQYPDGYPEPGQELGSAQS